MPAIVDHDQRRAEIVEIAVRLVDEGGAEAATVRAIAKAGGFSTKVVSHYFTDKRALMQMTYNYAADVAVSAAKRAPDVRTLTRDILPVDATMRRTWRVYLAFWGVAIVDAEFAAEQGERVRSSRERIFRLMKDDPRFAHLSTEARRREAKAILTCVMGVALQATFDPDAWPPARQFEAVDHQLALAELGLEREPNGRKSVSA